MTFPTPSAGRRRFLSALGVGAAGLAASRLLRPSVAWAVTPPLKFSNIPGTGDVKVLNYALALEDLEADLYAQALQRLTTGGTNALGTAIPGLGVSSNSVDVRFVAEFGVVEAQHRDLLRSTLGASAIHPFKYNFGIESKNRQQVLNLVYTAESTGVSAYLGAIPFFQTTTYLPVAGAIQGTEARHTAVFAEVINELFRDNLPVAPPPTQNHGADSPMTPDMVLAAVSPFIVVS